MRSIKNMLIERWYAFEDAVKMSKKDPSIDWTNDPGAMYSEEEDTSDGLVGEDEPMPPEKETEPARKSTVVDG
jgi:hypothetical protein